MAITTAVIMAGGFGTRLRPLTMDLPKPMVPLANTPMMEHIVRLLQRHGIARMVSLLYFHPEAITEYFGDGKKWGVEMEYILAAADFGTAGSVKNAETRLNSEPFVVISGDVLTDFDLSEAFAFHRERNASATIVLSRTANPLPYGIVIADGDGRIRRFLEKPSWGEVFSDTINTGIYILEPRVLDAIPSGREFDFSKDLFPLMLSRGEPLYGFTANGYWRDIGNLSEYQQAHYDVLDGIVSVHIGGQRSGNVWIGQDCHIGRDVEFRGRVIIGDGARIGDRAILDSCVIGRHCTIGPGSTIVRSVLWDNVRIGDIATIESSVIASDVTIEDGVAVLENVFIAAGCRIGDKATVGPNVKLWPNKVIEPHSIVVRSMIQEEKWSRELFTDARITGSSNVEMNPEFAARLGTAIGTALPIGSTVVASRDADATSRMIKRALVAGLLSAGVSIDDLQMTPIPQTRLTTRSRSVAAGFHVRRSFRNPNMTDIVIIGSDGRDISSELAKKIERFFFGEDIRRVPFERVGQLRYPERQNETYVSDYLRSLDTEAIVESRFRILIDYSFGMAVGIFPSILGKLGATALALNSYIDPYRAATTASDEENRREISDIMRSLGYQIGFKIDPGAERIALVDDRGYWFSSMRLLTIVTKLFLESNRDLAPFAIAVPVEATSEVDIIAAEYGVEVVRTKNSHTAMMEATRDERIRFVGGTRGGFIFPDYSVATDGLFTIGKILEMVAHTGLVLSELDTVLPKRHQVRRSIRCPWNKKGTLMRHAMEWSDRYERQLVDGVKVFFDDGSTVLLVPSSGAGDVVIIAEADTAEHAQHLADDIERLVLEWIDG